MYRCEQQRVTDVGARKDGETEVTLEFPAEPRITARFSGDFSGELSIDGVRESFAAESHQQLREVILSRVSGVAVELGRPVKVTIADEEGAWLLVVQANGQIGGEERVPDQPATDQPAIKENPFASLISLPSIPVTRLNPTVPSHPETWPNPSMQIDAEPEPAPLAGRRSFLKEERKKADRAKNGWRGFIAKTGVPINASAKERIEREETHSVSQHWPGPRTIAIVNGKGGANKTPTTAILAAVFARNGGSGVLAWDNNETRGTLGWRTEQGLHDATVQTLLPNTVHLLSPAAQSSDLSHFVHHQTGDKYDVLRSNPTMLATQQRISSDDFDNLPGPRRLVHRDRHGRNLPSGVLDAGTQEPHRLAVLFQRCPPPALHVLVHERGSPRVVPHAVPISCVCGGPGHMGAGGGSGRGVCREVTREI